MPKLFPIVLPEALNSLNPSNSRVYDFICSSILLSYDWMLAKCIATFTSTGGGLYPFFSAFTFTSHLNHFGWSTWTCSGSNIWRMRRSPFCIPFHSSGFLEPSTLKKLKSGVTQVGSPTPSLLLFFAFTNNLSASCIHWPLYLAVGIVKNLKRKTCDTDQTWFKGSTLVVTLSKQRSIGWKQPAADAHGKPLKMHWMRKSVK